MSLSAWSTVLYNNGGGRISEVLNRECVLLTTRSASEEGKVS